MNRSVIVHRSSDLHRTRKHACRPRRQSRPIALEPLEERTLLGVISDSANSELLNRSTMNSQSFFVYQDSDSALNHGFPSGMYGNISDIHLNTACIDDPSSSTGVTTGPNTLDRTHGNVIRIVFDSLSSGQFAGLNFEEPENWSVRHTQPGVQLRGYDLRGATDLVFEARSPTAGGVSVQFSVGGKTTSYVTVPQSSSFIKFDFKLASLGLTSNDLSSVNLLFGVSTNDQHDTAGGTLLLDNIQFTPVPTAQAAQLSLPLSNQTFGVVPQTTDPFPMDQVLRNVATTYEAALTVQSLLAQPTADGSIPAANLAAARGICDAFVYALGHENAGDPLPTTTVDGAAGVGLHNAYSAGDLALYNDQDPSLGELGKQGQVRLAGFTVPTSPNPSFYLMLDGATGGNNAFAMMALTKGYLQFGDTRYLDAAETIGRWIVGTLTDTTGTGYGGYYLGYPDAGQAKVLQTGKSVENNADIAAAFVMLSQVESMRGDATASAWWLQRAYVAGDFVMAMYDSVARRFNAGTVPAGTPAGYGIVPNGPQKGSDVINTADFLDSQTFAALSLAKLAPYRDQIDWWFISGINSLWTGVTATSGGVGRGYDGYSLVAAPNPAPGIPNPINGIAWEFTSQAAEAMIFVQKRYGMTWLSHDIIAAFLEIRQAQLYAPYGDGSGLVAATLDGENDGQGQGYPPAFQALSTPFQMIPERVGVAATAWAILVDQHVNPFELALPTTTTVKSSVSNPVVGQPLNFTATVTANPPSTSTPTGTVQFKLDGVYFGSAVDLVGGSASSPTTSTLTEGNHSITAVYMSTDDYFEGSTGTLPLTVASSSPTVTIVPVLPNPRNSAVGTITVRFSKSITGFDLADLKLTLNSRAVSLRGAQLTSPDGINWSLGSLTSKTGTPGTYQLTLIAAGSGIKDLSGNALATNASMSWVLDKTPPRATIATITPSSRTTPISSITIDFSEQVTGFDLSDLVLTRNGSVVRLSTASLTSPNGETWTLGNLSGLTNTAGSYVLTLKASGSSIKDLAGNALIANATRRWTMKKTVPAVKSALWVVYDP